VSLEQHHANGAHRRGGAKAAKSAAGKAKVTKPSKPARKAGGATNTWD
jgi:hypothetical protein